MSASAPHTDLEAGEDVAGPLLAAIEDGALGVVEELLARGTDPSTASTKDGTMPLVLASAGGHLGIVRRLLDHGADGDAALARPPEYDDVDDWEDE